MAVLHTCKKEENPIKNEGARVLTILTLPSVMESLRNSNSPRLLWLSLLPARMKKIQSEI